MKRILTALVLVLILFSCKTDSGKGKFNLTGELKGADEKKIYLEELFFSDKAPEVLDTGVVKNGKFEVTAIGKEEGLYRLRVENSENTYLFINDGQTISFTGDITNNNLDGFSFSGSANGSIKNSMRHIDSVGKLMSSKGQLLNTLIKSGAAANDSLVMVLNNEYNAITESFNNYCFAFADTAKSPIASLFVVTMAQVDVSKFEQPLASLAKRFPAHKGIATFSAFIKSRIAEQNTAQTTTPSPQTRPEAGSIAPEITMNDVNGKSFSLSQLRGKYVLVDFWASWCGPCRDQNPVVVAAYEQFKDKNFTVLGVSLDENKDAWTEAITEDKLTWQQVSDLKRWKSEVVGLYGFDGIPYNVLVDPQGKIIATDLRGNALQNKLAEVLK